MKDRLTPEKSDPLTLVDLAPYLPRPKAKGDAKGPRNADAAAAHLAQQEPIASPGSRGATPPSSRAPVHSAPGAANPPKSNEPTIILEPPRKRLQTSGSASRRAAGPLPPSTGATRSLRSGTPPPMPSSPSTPVPHEAIPQWLKERARVLEQRAERRRERLRTPPEELSLSTEIEMPEGMTKLVSQVAALIIFSLCGAIIFTLRWENVDFYWYRPVLNAYSMGVASFILSRFVIALFYRPPKDVGLEPTVSLIITAFNEEDAIRRTIAACYAADYPREKVEVIVVDDGSTDGTVPELERCTRRWPSLVVEKFEKNKGKREAMAAGARIAKGEILLYVDSDSFIRRDGIRAMVQGFADPRVAAVAGHTDVANARVNALTRMQDVRYYVAFRVIKAAESVFGAVTCCPGCFSAYRKTCVLEVLDAWLHQRFLGVQATFGDDRSLTNFLLRRYKVIYSSAAVATTLVPEHHKRFLKQQLRWKKSWLRECLIAATFMWKKHPLAAVAFYAQLCFPIVAPILVLRAFIWLPIVAGDLFSMAIYAFGVLMIGMIFSCYYLFYKADGLWIYGAHFTIYYMFVLIWQMPYAIATSRDNRWGTR